MDAALLGVVIIGRNEGERLRGCIESVLRSDGPVVYVDSGSTDDSVAMARGYGCETVDLDISIPFTAARARNSGFQALMLRQPTLRYVQFVDGDCEVVAGWLDSAFSFLESHPDFAVVFGRRRERHPERSVYNLLCDIDWDKPLGEIKACGGDALMRVAALSEVHGYRADLIAGEEPELCIRLRAAGWRIWRLDLDMTLHDAAMVRFGQWWMRSVRSGYASAEGAYLHGAAPEQHKVRESRSNWWWGLVLPSGVLLGIGILGPLVLMLLAIYPAQVCRLALKGQRTSRENWWAALFLMLGKFPEVQGQLKFLFNRIKGKQSRLIEYK
ncbi:MAG TPA: glycosyltransferase family A protein [Rhodocyclaceae bacterium]|nr:glycosyltransferase family A protein [Rhodocyclaceae bacterium]